MAKRSYPSPKVRGGDWECQAALAQEQPRGATPCLRLGVVAEMSYRTPEVRGSSREEQPQIQGAAAAWAQEGQEELLHVQGQEGWLVQGKEQWLHFAGTAMKRYLMSKVRETQVKW